MAEAAVESPAARFFCHKCTQEVSPVLPEYICPRCQCGFIEELTQGPTENISEGSDEEMDPAAQFAELWNSSWVDALRRIESDPSREASTTSENQQGSNDPSTSSGSSPFAQRTRPRFISRSLRRQGSHERQPMRQPLEGIIQQIFTNLMGGTGFVANAGFPVFLNLHGNPGDYAWGRGGLDAVITQLLNQLDGTGPPPMPRDKIDEIPTVHILQEQVDKVLQCTVCMEDFIVGEPVKRLSCQHHFHKDCIIPWLELHGTCPICRKYLTDEASHNFVDIENSGNSEATSSSSTSSEPGTSGSNSSVTRSRRGSSSSSLASGSSGVGAHTTSVYEFLDEYD